MNSKLLPAALGAALTVSACDQQGESVPERTEEQKIEALAETVRQTLSKKGITHIVNEEIDRDFIKENCRGAEYYDVRCNIPISKDPKIADTRTDMLMDCTVPKNFGGKSNGKCYIKGVETRQNFKNNESPQ